MRVARKCLRKKGIPVERCNRVLLPKTEQKIIIDGCFRRQLQACKVGVDGVFDGKNLLAAAALCDQFVVDVFEVSMSPPNARPIHCWRKVQTVYKVSHDGQTLASSVTSWCSRHAGTRAYNDQMG